MQLIPHFFHPDAFQKTLEAEGHKNSYIRTALSYLQSLKNLLIAHSLHVLPPLSCPYTVDSDHNSSSSLQGQQLAIFHTFKLFLPARTEYYTSGRQVDINWKQFILITGPQEVERALFFVPVLNMPLIIITLYLLPLHLVHLLASTKICTLHNLHRIQFIHCFTSLSPHSILIQ